MMIRRWQLILVLLAAAAFPWSVSEAARAKIAVVDMQRFQEKSKNFQKIAAELRQKYEALRQKLNQEKEALVKLEEEFRRQSMMLSLDAREDKQRELEKKSRYLKYLQNEYTQEMKGAEFDARRRVTQEVAKVVKDIGRKKGYLLILDKGTIGLIYADDTIDITDEVIQAYDKGK